MKDLLQIVDCLELTDTQLKSVRSLKVSDTQVEFGGSFESSLDNYMTNQSETIRCCCFMKQHTAVGIVVLMRPPSSPDWVPYNAVSLHGLKIDQQWQGKGLGKVAFRLAVDAAAKIWLDADQIVLSVDAGNDVALAIYRGYGMEDSGPLYTGRIGKEHRLTKIFDR